MQLDRRKQTLLNQVVITYVQRAEPVGSHFLATQDGLGVRSATIRNELAEMTDLGYLRQPHTSAGRIPSDLGYRYYVDHLMTWDRLPSAEVRTVKNALRMNEGDLELLLEETCRVLSALTRYTSVATAPTATPPVVRTVHVVQLTPRRLLAVVVLSNGQVVHRFAESPRALSPAEAVRVGNALDEHLRDHDAASVSAAVRPGEAPPGLEDVVKLLLELIARGLKGEEADLYIEGTSRMLEQPEFREANRLEPLVRFLEERRSAFELLRELGHRRDVAIGIGSEHTAEELQEVSVVAAQYRAGEGSVGWVAVLGPTRMHYAHAVPVVQYVARTLSETLERLGRSE